MGQTTMMKHLRQKNEYERMLKRQIEYKSKLARSQMVAATR